MLAGAAAQQGDFIGQSLVRHIPAAQARAKADEDKVALEQVEPSIGAKIRADGQKTTAAGQRERLAPGLAVSAPDRDVTGAVGGVFGQGIEMPLGIDCQGLQRFVQRQVAKTLRAGQYPRPG